jgi:hypothetical protein
VVVLPGVKPGNNVKVQNNVKAKKIVCLIFPENPVFENNWYRTPVLNVLLYLMTKKDNKLQPRKTKKSGNAAGLSRVAPPSGLEPETL